MTTRLMPVAVFLVVGFAWVAYAQYEEQPEPDTEASTGAARTVGKETPATAKDRAREEAVRALLGEEESTPATREPSRPERPTTGAAEPGPSRPAAAPVRPPRTGVSPRRPLPEPSEAIPEVPVDRGPAERTRVGRPTAEPSGMPPRPSGAGVDVEPAVPATVDDLATPPAREAPAAPGATLIAPRSVPNLDTYRAPALAPESVPADTSAEVVGNAEAMPSGEGGRSSATTIIIGLIVLAVLLVALAAVVGVMAAQRARMGEPRTLHSPLTGWAYLAAPNAPNISLQKTPFLMGSSPTCDLRLADPKCSPQHARIDRTQAGYVLTDLNSTNGTYLNGERIASPVTLQPGDEIRMGDIVVNFEIYEA